MSYSEQVCINNFPTINYYKKMADSIHHSEHSEHSDNEIQASQPPKKRTKIVETSDEDSLDGITYSVTLDAFFKCCILIFGTPFEFQQRLMFSLPIIKKQLKMEVKPMKRIVYHMIKAVHNLYQPAMKEYVGWESFFQKLTESTWSKESYDGILIPNVKKFFENYVATSTDSVDNSSSSLTTPNKTLNTSMLYTTAINQEANVDAPLSLDSILYDIPAPSTSNCLYPQSRISTISEIMRVRTSDGLNTYELNGPTEDYYVTMRIIPASVVTNPQIQSQQWWKHAKQELRFSVKERSTDPVSQSMFKMVKEVTNKIVNSPNCTQTYRPFSNWNNFS